MASSNQWISLSITLFVLVGSISAQTKDSLSVVVNDVPEPEIDMEIGPHHVEARYYDPMMTGERYGQARRDFDVELFQAVKKFSMDFVRDVVINNCYTITLSKHVYHLTALLAKYLPPYQKFVRASGPVKRHGFIPDTLSLFTLVENKLKSNAPMVYPVPKDGPDFMVRFEKTLDLFAKVIENNPVGIYLDYSKAMIDDNRFYEMLAPFLKYMKDNGYNGGVKTLNTMVKVMLKIKKPSADGSIEIPTA